jgi:hypothetical protein
MEGPKAIQFTVDTMRLTSLSCQPCSGKCSYASWSPPRDRSRRPGSRAPTNESLSRPGALDLHCSEPAAWVLRHQHPLALFSNGRARRRYRAEHPASTIGEEKTASFLRSQIGTQPGPPSKHTHRSPAVKHTTRPWLRLLRTWLGSKPLIS